MPTYLCHGFRWHRRAIRVYIVVQNLDDGTPEWIITRGSPECLIESFYNLFDFLPECTFPPSTRNSSRSRSASYSAHDRVPLTAVPPPPLPRGASQLQQNSDQQQRPDSITTDDSSSIRTTNRRPRSHSKSRSRSRSRSRTRTHALHQQRSQPALSTRGRDNTQNQQTPPGRQSSNSSRKRSRPQPNTSLPYRGGPPPPLPLSYHRTTSFSAAPPDPIQAQAWSPVTLLEEYDPSNLSEVSRPHAYVADHVVRIDSAASVVEEIQRYEQSVRHAPVPPVTGSSSDEMLCKQQRRGPGTGGWFERLRDELQRDEEIRWWIVVNGDEERAWNGGGGSVEESSSVATESVVGEDEEGATPAVDGAKMAHMAYSQQCRVWEEQAREEKEARKRERRERERKPMPKTLPPPPPPAPLLHTQVSMEQLSGQETPKTPGKAGSGFRKLFSRGGKSDEATTPTS